MKNQIVQFAVVNTKSNFKNLNGKCLRVKEIFENFITCEFFDFDSNQIITADFCKNEFYLIQTFSK